METARRGGILSRFQELSGPLSPLLLSNGFSAPRTGLEGPPWVSPERRARASPARVGEAAMAQRGSGLGHAGGPEHQAAAMEHPDIRTFEKCFAALLREQEFVRSYQDSDEKFGAKKDDKDWKNVLNDLIDSLPPRGKASSAAIITGLHVSIVRIVRNIDRDELQVADFNQFCARAVDAIHSKRQEFNEDVEVQAAGFLCLRAIETECNI